ncbi:MAG TPA: globin [Nitrobacter sp.]|nr:globin [Nitrobacter sp.]
MSIAAGFMNSPHDAYGTPPELFGQFFGIIAATLKEILGADWSTDMDSAWRHLLLELDRFIAHLDWSGSFLLAPRDNRRCSIRKFTR